MSQYVHAGAVLCRLECVEQSQGRSEQPLDATHVSTFTLTPDQTLKVYIDLQDGRGPQAYTGDRKAIVLKSHEVISLVITPPDNHPARLHIRQRALALAGLEQDPGRPVVLERVLAVGRALRLVCQAEVGLSTASPLKT